MKVSRMPQGYKNGGKVKESRAEEMKEAKMIKAGKMSPAQYANMESREGYRDGGMVWDCTQGTGVRSHQDYRK